MKDELPEGFHLAYPALHAIVHRYGMPRGATAAQQDRARADLVRLIHLFALRCDGRGGELIVLAERVQALASIMAVVDEMPSKEELDAGYEEALAIAEGLHAMSQGDGQ